MCFSAAAHSNGSQRQYWAQFQPDFHNSGLHAGEYAGQSRLDHLPIGDPRTEIRRNYREIAFLRALPEARCTTALHRKLPSSAPALRER